MRWKGLDTNASRTRPRSARQSLAAGHATTIGEVAGTVPALGSHFKYNDIHVSAGHIDAREALPTTRFPGRRLDGGLVGVVAQYLLPWEFSPTVFVTALLFTVLYVRGAAVLRRRGTPPGAWRATAFFTGVALNYIALQTYVDYLSQHMFWVHRLQHLVLHHIAPILIVAAAPAAALRNGLPRRVSALVPRPLGRQTLAWKVIRALQSPPVALLLFVGLIYYWLTPSVHFAAMLDANRYLLMNWSMAVDGILFWWLMLASRRRQGRLAVGYGVRILMLCVAALLQILLGAYITLHSTVLFDVYGLCGRAWAVSPLVDQELGGLLTWIPPAMMSGLGVILVLHLALHDSGSRSEPVPAAGARAPELAAR
jgi:putative membrane protein